MSLGMQVLMLYYGRQLIKSGHMTTGNLVSFILYQGDLGTYIRVWTHFVLINLFSYSCCIRLNFWMGVVFPEAVRENWVSNWV